MAIDEIVSDPNLSTVLNASRDTRLQALGLVDQIAAAGPIVHAPTDAQLETSKQQKLLITNLAQLRGLHRAAYFGARQTKAQTSEARQEVDRLHLQLQNLYYEQRHLQGEISACESYESVPVTISRSTRPTRTETPQEYMHSATQLAQELIKFTNSHSYQQLPLIPVEEFLTLKPEHADDDENTLMVARIEHERSEREALEQKRMELLKRKQKLIADNKRRKDGLSNLDKELEKFIDVGVLCNTFMCLPALTRMQSAKPITKLFDKNV
ncbi:Uu.00g038400.m01.CDS01 [Anthostomella pinea]|uniref:Uu.00g038400.m01.CDS01 n=1 Tax=Anthostomella pinea TaxID=933095 RepID=A0AAI8YDR6_9PEZI|nr:Uu.00g038400.m01.CDS01 [Anthostomella pinea]